MPLVAPLWLDCQATCLLQLQVHSPTANSITSLFSHLPLCCLASETSKKACSEIVLNLLITSAVFSWLHSVLFCLFLRKRRHVFFSFRPPTVAVAVFLRVAEQPECLHTSSYSPRLWSTILCSSSTSANICPFAVAFPPQ